jgi:hypothetical protein
MGNIASPFLYEAVACRALQPAMMRQRAISRYALWVAVVVATVGFLRPGIGATVPLFSSSGDVSWRAWRRVRDKSEIVCAGGASMRFGFRPT